MRFVVGVALLLAVSATPWAAGAGAPSIDDRVAARRAVEEVLWRHRLWPSENAQPKPPLSAVLSDAEIRARVVDDLRKSKALEVLWHRPVTPAMLQAELDRMTAGSRAPDVLAEMLAAVGHDPVLAREAIARPALVDRLARSWYAHDDRYHGASKRRAEAGVGGTVAELTWRRDELDDGAWEKWNARVVERAGRVSDEEDAFRAYAVKERGDGTLRVTVTSWPKRPFEAYWSAHAASFAPDTALPEADSAPAPPLPALPGSCANDTWRPLGDVTAGPRHSHSAVWTGSEMIVFGGWTPSGATATGGRYVPATDAWYKTAATNAPAARVLHPAVWTGTEMIVWGGQQDLAGPYGPLGDGARYAPATDTWTSIAMPGAPSARRELTMIWTGSRAIVFGGIEASTARTNTGGRYDPSTNSWAPTSTGGAPTPRSEHSAAWAGSVMVIWGGAPGASTNTGGRYDPVADTWAPTSTLNAPSARSGATAVWTGSRVIVWGGVNIAAHFQDGGRYDPSADSWSGTTIEGAPGGRELHTAIWTGSQMIVWGGSLGTANTEYSGGGRYDPTTDAWSPVSTSNTPERRRSHTAVWSGSEMIVWGGVWELPHPGTFIQYLDNGGRYAPATNSWVPTSVKTNGPPSARAFHTSVWTGAETVIWGGSIFNDGGRYIAATDSWFPTATTGAPAVRSSHTAVWTGSEMIVWGGDDVGFNPLGTGGRYNPSSDTWAGVSIAGAPNGVSVHTAVWTGSRMIVWGGRTSSTLSNEGGRYDPSTDTWTATSIANAPDGRYLHTAAWTGSRMVVWGGSTLFNVGSEGVNTGGRYDPVTDSWSATATVNAPQGRAGHVSVWTGSSLVVWGGNCCFNGTLLDTGGRYDPAANSWSATSTAGAPTGRTYASAAWTGLEMIVWGGSSGGRVNTGGRYIPATDAWTATTVAGAPSARDAHAATWAGNSMLVFGGSDGGPLGNGASYCACTSLFRDLDGDGWGGPFFLSESCDGTIPAGYVLTQGDCNDGDVFIHPGALDNTCNGVDEDCNGVNDDLWIGGLSQCGLGVCHATGFFECTNGQVINNCTPGTPLDTFDANCNNVDEDCDGAVDDDYAQREDYWSPLANSPTSRTNHTTVMTGSEMIVFGGDDGSGTVKTGGDAYAPATNTWRTLGAGPAKRWRHTAVWTGSRMIVWGGDDNVATVYNNGSRYDPGTDTWAATTATGAPAARLWHSAVWTGSRMVVWGGRDVSSSLSSGSRYDPVGNTWSATATSGAPAARSLHTAVWTGTEMVVWGGFSTVPLATGSRYDPVGNSWTAVASAGGLAGRYGHVAVWTGTEMIVWGGTDGSSYFGNGLRYSPSANAWSAMSSTGAPSQRAFASAAWTGTELIVWGGADGASGSDTLSDGARYNPATNTWTAMSPVSNPIDRARASGVWTGSELLVWGGDPNGASRADGGRYVPKTLCGIGGCQRTGHMVCSAGVASFQCVPAAPTAEVCDGLDNDCNVTVDDGIPVPAGHPVLILSRLASPINTRFSWGAVPGATSYDTVRGFLSQLRASAGDFATSTINCHFDALPDTEFQDNNGPPPGEGFWFLVRPVNACSGNGTYNDFAPPQQGARDAEINASGNDCP